MDTVKTVYNWMKNNLLIVFGAVIGVLAFILSLKNKRIDVLEASKVLHDTQAKDQVLTSQQEADKQQMVVNNNSLDKVNQSMVQLEQDQVVKTDEQKNKTPAKIVDYWNKSKN